MIPSDFHCEQHPAILATALCGLCLKPLCGDCAVEEHGACFCDESHRATFAKHTKLTVVSSPFEADAIAANLRPLELEPKVYFLRDHVGPALDLAEDVSYVFVESARAAESRAALVSLNLLEEPS